MTNRKTTGALVSSVIALVLCCAMLVGSTFAWFTDSASTAVNTIQSGTLKVDLVDATGNSLDGESLSFVDVNGNANILWEPGATFKTQQFKVVNDGNLALQYEIVINGVNGNAELLSAIEFWLEDAAGSKVTLGTANKLEADGETALYTLVGHMKEEAGNEYQGLTLSGLGISVYATQVPHETDSFGPDYDAVTMTTVDNADALKAALAEGGVVALTEDIAIDATVGADGKAQFGLSVPAGKSALLDLNGHELNYVANPTANGNHGVIQVKGDLTIIGEGKVTAKTNYDMAWNALSAVVSVEGGSLTLGEGVELIHKGGTSMAYAVDVNTTLGETVLNIDGAVLSSSYIGVRIFNNNKTQKGIVNFNDGFVDGGRRDVWVHNASAAAVDANGIVNIADGYTYETTVQDASSFYGRIYDFTSHAVATTTDALAEAVKTPDATVYVVAGEYTFPASSVAAGTTLVCDEGTVFEGKSSLDIKGATVVGATFSNPTGTAVGSTINGTFKDCVFEGSNGLRWCYAGDTVVFENCVFSGDVYGVHFDGGANEVVFKNCTISGFNATAGSIELITFEGCTFVANGKSNYNGINLWGSAELKNCTFVFDGTADYEWIDLCGENKTLTITNCVVTDGTTTSDVATLIGNELTKRHDSGKIIVDGAELTY